MGPTGPEFEESGRSRNAHDSPARLSGVGGFIEAVCNRDEIEAGDAARLNQITESRP
jgi:hypothetical protein